jgi:chromate reductase
MPVRVVTLVGSLRQGSYNRALMNAALAHLPADASVTDLDPRSVPLYDGDLDGPTKPGAVVAAFDALREADLLLVATPEYNHSVPGGLKNVLDWLSRARPSVLAGKRAAILGASTGAVGTARAQLHLREILASNGVRVLVGTEVLVARAAERFDAEGALVDEPTRAHLAKFVAAALAV